MKVFDQLMPAPNQLNRQRADEISRSRVWQWIHSRHGVLDDGRKVTLEMVRAMIPEALVIITGG